MVEDTLRVLVGGHDGAQVGHCFFIFGGVGDCGERVGPAFVGGEWDDIGPERVSGVFTHCCGVAVSVSVWVCGGWKVGGRCLEES